MATQDLSPSADDEPAGAVREAAALLLAGQGGSMPDPDEVTAKASQAEIFQGTGTLIAGLLGVIAGDDDDSLDLVAPVLRQLRRVEPDIPAEVVATVGGALIAGALGHSPTRWRTRGLMSAEGQLPVAAVEAYAWTVTGRLLVDLLDHVSGVGSSAALLGQLWAEEG